MKLNVDQILRATGGQILQLKEKEFDSFGIDSRSIRKGGLFFALRGEHTDGHLFLSDAFHQGAAGAIIQQNSNPGTYSATLIHVADTLKALHDLSAFVRAESKAKFVGITGSSGKTTAKEFTATLLSQKYSVFKSEGNLNSITGLPLSLLAMNHPECAVFEVAMNQPGEIATLACLLKPQIGVLLNVNPVHQSQFPSIDAIADEKCSLLRGMATGSTLIYNADDGLIGSRIKDQQLRLLSYGLSTMADLRITEVDLQGVRGSRAVFQWNKAKIPLETGLCGLSNLYNIAAAACSALLLDLTWDQILDSIRGLEPYSHRGTLIRMNDIHIYDDCYNSNPKALEMALEIIRRSKGYRRRIAVLGDMLELGPEESRFHYNAGEQVVSSGVDVLVTVGPLSKHMAEAAPKSGMKEVYEVANSEEASAMVGNTAKEGDLILVKGSRGIQMEKVIEGLARLFESRLPT